MISSKMTLAVVLIAVVVMIVGSATSFTLSGSEPETHVKQTRSVDTTLSQPIQVCGLRLLEAVRFICRNRGGYMMSRRSDPSLSLAPLYEELEMPMSNSLDGMEGNSQYQNDAYSSDIGVDFPDTADSSWNAPSKLMLKVWSEAKQGVQQQQHARFRRNIIDECCKRACPRSQMVKYCVRG